MNQSRILYLIFTELISYVKINIVSQIKMDENNFNSGPGRPCITIDINFSDPLKAIDQIKSICKNSKVKQNVNEFATALLKLNDTNESSSTQTDMDGMDYVSDVLEILLVMT